MYRKLLILSLILLPVFSSCEFTELDLQDNPNEASPDEIKVEFLYNEIQLAFKDFFEETWNLASLVRMSTKNEFYYQLAYPDSIGDSMWTFAYSGLFTNVDQLLLLTDKSSDYQLERASSKILKAYTLFSLVDIFGDIPLSESGQGTGQISPDSEQGSHAYNQALIFLDEALAELQDLENMALENDLFYQGEVSKWIALANTLKLRAFANTRLVDSESGRKIAEILASGDIIDELEEGFTFKYGTNRLNPNSRHPLYNIAYESDPPPYLSNYYMWLLAGNEDLPDPRLRFYFYRQISNSLNQEPSAYACYHNPGLPDNAFYPSHYASVDPNLPYCIAAEEGYYGRDHLNGTEIRPDGPFRTTFGVYPAGGKFDNNSFLSVSNSGIDGALGKGMQPIWLSSFTYFTLAEAHLLLSTGGDARSSLAQGIQHSFDQVFQNSPTRFEEFCDVAPCPLSSEGFRHIVESKSTYLAKVLKEWDNAADNEARLDIIAREYLIALWGNGLEAYNLYRRTAKPLNIQPAISTQHGNFPRSLLYPAVHVNRNQQVDQKPGYTPVFWDTNDASLFR